MSGSGIGGMLGSLAGVALAPETGGLSLAIPALTGAAGAELGNVVTGNQQNPLMAALMGGIGGGLSGGLANGDIGSLFSGAGDAAGTAGAAGAATDAAAAATDAAGSAGSAAAADVGSLAPLDSSISGAGIQGIDPTASMAGEPAGLAGAGTANTGSSATDNLVNKFAAEQGTSGASGANPSMLSRIGGYLGKQNPLSLALAGETALSGIQSLLPKPSVNIGQTAAQVKATDPNWSATLPQYKMQNTASPYQGNWYTYGQQPEVAMYNAQPVLQAHGGLIKRYAAGGKVISPSNRVNPLAGVMPRLSTALRSNTPPMHGSRLSMGHGYAMGGNVMPGVGPQQGAGQPNPLQLAAVHKIGMAIGQHLKAHGYDPHKTPTGPVHGAGGGQDDAIPAKLSDGEFIIPADIVSALGDGSSKEGGKKLSGMLDKVRTQKTSHGSKFPPKAKNPLSYIGAAS